MNFNLNFNDLNIQLSHRHVMGICIGLSILVFITFISSIWQWHNDWVFIHQDSKMPAITKIDTNELIASIPENHIFGKAMSQMPITNLQMRVTGIVKTSDQSGLPSKAYISVEGQPGKIYQQGDDLPNGVRINTISQDAVILDIEGRLEKLPLPREKLQFKSRPKESL